MVMTVRIHEYGGPEVLRYVDVAIGSPGPGEVLVRHRAIGLNFADIHTREGRYPVASLPHAIGGEGHVRHERPDPVNWRRGEGKIGFRETTPCKVA